MTTVTLSEPMRKALAVAINGGMVFAGYDVSRKGSKFLTSAKTLTALAKLGYITLTISPDGGTFGRVTEEGRLAFLGALPLN